MCGRYSFTLTKEKIAERFQVKVLQDYKPRYNVSPLQVMPVITNANPGEISFFQWGLIPNWSLDSSSAVNLINAKAETILSKAPFKQIVHKQRCLVPADGYFEWRKIGKNKVPHRITLASDEPFSFAGLWDSWDDGSSIINTYTIITTPANEVVREVNDRMPVILPKEAESIWLDGALKDKDIQALLKAYEGNKMSYYKSHRIVNSPDYDTPECIQAAPKLYPGETFFLFE